MHFLFCLNKVLLCLVADGENCRIKTGTVRSPSQTSMRFRETLLIRYEDGAVGDW
jgi:hypothetical protein